MHIKTEFYDLIPNENLLFIKSFLSWDERVIESIFKDVDKIRLTYYSNSDWAILTDCRNWDSGTPKVAENLLKAALSDLTKGLTRHAIVVGQSELKKWQFSKTIQPEKHFETKLFETIEAAENWLASSGYHLSSNK